MTIFSCLVPVVTSSFVVQLGLALFFVPRAEARFYDLSGAAGFLITTLVSIYYPISLPHVRSVGALQTPVPLPESHVNFAPRQLLLTAALVAWAGRLGAFLAQRAINAGGDSSFYEIKHDRVKFTVAWIAQVTWIFVVGLPVYLSNLIPASAHPPLRVRDYAVLAFVATPFALEVTADHQKSTWRRACNSDKHDEMFVASGLWAWSRHPNYVGEVGIRTGMWGLSALSGAPPWQAVLLSAASPVGTYLLIRYVSGVPPLEQAGDKKFGDDPSGRNTSGLFLYFFPWGAYE